MKVERTTCKAVGLQSDAVARAIDWAVSEGVHLINMSCGFSPPKHTVKEALKRARQAKVIVFAATSNCGNNGSHGAAWPAKEPSLAVGIHSCKDLGMKASDFTPPPVRNSDNFMVVGERIPTHWPELKGGGFRFADGTSFATPVATATTALVLAFVWQKRCTKGKEAADRLFGEDAFLELENMAKVLHAISNPATDAGYAYIHPGLMWKDFDPRVKGVGDTPQAQKSHDWEVIRAALHS